MGNLITNIKINHSTNIVKPFFASTFKNGTQSNGWEGVLKKIIRYTTVAKGNNIQK